MPPSDQLLGWMDQPTTTRYFGFQLNDPPWGKTSSMPTLKKKRSHTANEVYAEGKRRCRLHQESLEKYFTASPNPRSKESFSWLLLTTSTRMQRSSHRQLKGSAEPPYTFHLRKGKQEFWRLTHLEDADWLETGEDRCVSSWKRPQVESEPKQQSKSDSENLRPPPLPPRAALPGKNAWVNSASMRSMQSRLELNFSLKNKMTTTNPAQPERPRRALGPGGRAPLACPLGGRSREAVSPVLCAAAAPADRRSAFSFLPMLKCCPRLHTRFLPSGPRGQAWQIPSDPANQPRPGQLPGPGSLRAAPCRDSPPPGSTGPAFAQARQQRAGPSTSQTVLPLRPCAKNAARASRGGSEAPAGVTRDRSPGSEPADLAALVSQTLLLPQRVIGRHERWNSPPPEVTSRLSQWLTLEPGSKTPRPQEAEMGGEKVKTELWRP